MDLVRNVCRKNKVIIKRFLWVNIFAYSALQWCHSGYALGFTSRMDKTTEDALLMYMQHMLGSQRTACIGGQRTACIGVTGRLHQTPRTISSCAHESKTSFETSLRWSSVTLRNAALENR